MARKCSPRITDENNLANAEDLKGQKFGKLTVLGFYKRERRGKAKTWSIFWTCSCECDSGKEVIALGRSLKAGYKKSCGCIPRIKPLGDRRDKLIRKVYQYYQSNARAKNKDFLLNRKEFDNLIFSPCFYCGAKETNSAKDWTKKLKNNPIPRKISDTVVYYNGIDRIDSNEGYILSNVIPCCQYCNWAKSDYSQEYFINKIKQIYNHLNLGDK